MFGVWGGVGGVVGRWDSGCVGCGERWDTRFLKSIYVMTEIRWISGRDGDALVEDILVRQMRHPVFFPSVWQG